MNTILIYDHIENDYKTVIDLKELIKCYENNSLLNEMEKILKERE